MADTLRLKTRTSTATRARADKRDEDEQVGLREQGGGSFGFMEPGTFCPFFFTFFILVLVFSQAGKTECTKPLSAPHVGVLTGRGTRTYLTLTTK